MGGRSVPTLFGVREDVYDFCNALLPESAERFAAIDDIAEHNSAKVLTAMRRNRLADAHFGGATGYGYNDAGRDVVEQIFADVFGAEAALVRAQIISGTHAIKTALFGQLCHGDGLILATGLPYDTLHAVVGIRAAKGSLAEHGVEHTIVPLRDDGGINIDGIINALKPNVKVAAFQRSKGYNWRRSFFPSEIGEAIRAVKAVRPDVICFVDNCYGEFVLTEEPTDFGADLMAGSLIKNAGGGIAPVGGYIVGKREYVENAAYCLTAPGLGAEVGPSLGLTRFIAQGLFFAPSVTAAAVKGAVFTAAVFDRLCYEVLPSPCEARADIVQAVKLRSKEAVLAYCGGIQSGSPVDSFAAPEPWDMPGYDCPIVMAAGAFTQGASIELSADAPIREPFSVFSQGGLTWEHAKLGVINAVNTLVERGIVHI